MGPLGAPWGVLGAVFWSPFGVLGAPWGLFGRVVPNFGPTPRKYRACRAEQASGQTCEYIEREARFLGGGWVPQDSAGMRKTRQDTSKYPRPPADRPWSSLGSPFGRPWWSVGFLEVSLGRPWASWGVLGASLGGLWAPLGSFRVSLGGPWGALGGPLGSLGGSLGVLGESLGDPWGSLGLLGGSLGLSFGTLLASLGLLGGCSANFRSAALKHCPCRSKHASG